MKEKEAIEILKYMNDGYTFQDCRVCVSNNKFNEKQGICESKTCEYLNAINTVIQALEQKDKMIKKAYIEANNVLYFDDDSDYCSALWTILHTLNPDLEEYPELSYIEESEGRK